MNSQARVPTASTLTSSSTDSGACPQSDMQANAGTEALLCKDDPQFWFEIERLFGAAEYGGALFEGPRASVS